MQSSSLSIFHLSSTTSFELALSAGASSLARVYFNDPFSTVPTVLPKVATVCLTVADWIVEGGERLTHVPCCIPSSVAWGDSAKATIRLYFVFSFLVESMPAVPVRLLHMLQ